VEKEAISIKKKRKKRRGHQTFFDEKNSERLCKRGGEGGEVTL